MNSRIRLEVSVAATLAVAIVALVLAIRAGGPEAVAVVDQATSDTEVGAVLDLVPKGALAVEIVDFAYDPEPVRVRAGTTVAWTNLDAAPHTVTAQDDVWGSQVLSQGDVWTATFDEPGVYVYICELHPPRSAAYYSAPEGVALADGGGGGMQGTIIVE